MQSHMLKNIKFPVSLNDTCCCFRSRAACSGTGTTPTVRSYLPPSDYDDREQETQREFIQVLTQRKYKLM